MTTYRLTTWIPLYGNLDQLKVRRALTAMSVAPVRHRQLGSEFGLRRSEVNALLRTLREARALEINAPALVAYDAAAPNSPTPCDIELPLEDTRPRFS